MLPRCRKHHDEILTPEEICSLYSSVITSITGDKSVTLNFLP